MSSEHDSWWAQWPDLRAGELAAFEKHGAATQVEFERNGLLCISVTWPVQGRDPMQLRVGFSSLHPFFRPEISAPEERFDRHQNPIGHSLCLVAHGEDQWDSNERVADVIHRQLTKLLAVMDARSKGDFEEAKKHEDHFADPITIYWQGLSEHNSAAYLDRKAVVPVDLIGLADASCLERGVPTNNADNALELVLSRFRRFSGPTLATPFNLPQPQGAWKNIPARWVRTSTDGCQSVDSLVARALAVAKGAPLAARHLAAWFDVERAPLSVTVIVVQNAADYTGQEKRDGFLFILTRREKKKVTHRLVRSFEISDDIFDRLPVGRALRDKRVLLIGCGAIGGFVALELARAGFGHLTVVDHDVLEPGNYVRWPFGRQLWGISKALLLRALIGQNYPWTMVAAIDGKFGAAGSDVEALKAAKGNPFLTVVGAIQEADIVIDATASAECQQAVAYYCNRLGKALVIGNATLGAAGGIVAQFRSDAAACFNCARQQWKADGLPEPAVDERGSLVPVGCNQETFTGGSYDLQEVSLQMVRSAIGLVAPDALNAGEWDLAVLSHLQEGERTLPRWETAKIKPVLPCCTVKKAA
jgi:hypothetical protein